MAAYYNEHDPFAANWLRNLIRAGHIAPGEVDERNIQDVKAADLAGFTQCHWFAGIGGWSYALRLAGWPDDEPVWTGSCPCQPFSAAGRQEGKADARHLWPVWSRLIRECRPARIFGEQVASSIAHGWLDEAATDLEAEGYAVASCVLPACSVGKPHRRDRLWFVANAGGSRSLSVALAGVCGREEGTRPRDEQPQRCGSVVADAQCYAGCSKHGNQSGQRSPQESNHASGVGPGCEVRALANAASQRLEERRESRSTGAQQPAAERGCILEHADFDGWEPGSETASNLGHGSPADAASWILCGDGKRRPVEPSIRLLVDGLPGRVGRLRGYGNAIVPAVAAEFIRAAMEAA